MSETFDLLHSKVAKIAKKRFSTATAIQKEAIPKILKGKNVLVIAGTGMGKTESVALPILSKLAAEEHKPIALLYLTPLKALNRDMLDRLVWWSHKLDLEIGVRHGDTTPYQRKVQVEYPPHILISTPEQIQAMLSGKRLRKLLENIKYIIVDEVHELADNKRGVQLTVALERLKQLCGKPQIIALSATIGSPKEVADFIGCDEIVDVASEKKFSITVKSPYPGKGDMILAEKIFIGESVASRLRVIHDLIKNHKSTLTFTNTRQAAEVLSSRMLKMDKELKQAIHHSSLSKNARIKTEDEFKKGKLKSIICTSSLQLGIDIGLIDLVIQYLSPREVTQVTQRFGRAGHSIEKVSKGVIITAEGDDIFESAVIARKMLAGELEEVRFHRKPWDVLSHQIIGIANDEYKIDLKKMFSILKRAYPYKDLTKKEFYELLEFMNSLSLIWVNKTSTKETLTRGRKALKYYFQNLSTIPDSKSYLVIDMTTQKAIGMLDEGFIMEHSESGSTFIVKGMPWRVVSIEGTKVYVEPSTNLESAIPSWEGEMIPVPYEIAQEVARLREIIFRLARVGMKKDAIEKIKKFYPVDSQSARKMYKWVESQKEYEMPARNKITMERYGDYVVVNACFGSRVNETLAKFIAAIIAAEHGRAVQSKTDPYRMIFQNVRFEDIRNVLVNYKPQDVQIVLENSLENSMFFKHKFLQVAKRMGAVRKDSTMERISLKKLVSVYKLSFLHKETLNEIFTEKLDVEKAEEIMKKIKNKKIKLVESDKISPISEFGLRYEMHDIATPNRPEREILRLFKQRLMNTKLRLVCVNCAKWDQTYFVRDIPKTPRCPKCSSRLISAVHPHMTEAKMIVKKRLEGKDLSMENQKKLVRIRRAADMIIVYGAKACQTLAGRGIGPQTCARVLARMHKDDKEFYKDLLKAERDFIRTKKYWSD